MTSEKLCPACTLDPDPRGLPSACFDCRELNRVLAAIPATVHVEQLGSMGTRFARPVHDLSDVHVDRVARRLFRAFDNANKGREPLHDFDVMAQCEYDGRQVIDNWRALALEAILLGAVVTAEEVSS